MNIRPFRDIKRRKTKEINVGKVKVGGNNPITVQSMTNTLTTDIKATIKQINEIHSEGADIVRVSCPDETSSKSPISTSTLWIITLVVIALIVVLFSAFAPGKIKKL